MSEHAKVSTYIPVIVAIVAAVGVGEGVDFGQDYSEDIADAEYDRQIIREEMSYLWDENNFNYNDISTLYDMLCNDGYQKACDYWYGE